MGIWWSMLREPHLTDGTGARTAHNTLCTSTKDVLGDRILTFATSAKQKKKSKNAHAQSKALVQQKKNAVKNSEDVLQIVVLFFSDFLQRLILSFNKYLQSVNILLYALHFQVFLQNS
jgi:hypothetical protein